MTKKISWLHISDLHFGQKEQHLWPNFREQFHDDLLFLLQENGPIELVIFSGDLTQTASAAEFEQLEEELVMLWKIFSDFGCSPLLFPVPGNHDLVRPDSGNAQVKMLKQWATDSEVTSELLSSADNQYMDVINRAFKNYEYWYDHSKIPMARDKKGIIPGDTSYVLNSGDLKIGLIGLNSSYLQLSGGDFQGKLLLSPKQISKITGGDPATWCSNNDYNFIVTHHPLDWLHTASKNNFLKEIYKPGRFLAHLHGHMHEASNENYSLNGSENRRSVQASSLFGLEKWGESSSNDRIHGYSLNKLQVDSSITTWTMWPRIRMENEDDDYIAPNHKFKLIRGKEYFITAISENKGNIASENPFVEKKIDMTVEVETLKGDHALSRSAIKLIASEHHIKIRINEQIICSEALTAGGIAWLAANWGVGRDEFIWTVLRRLGKDKLPVYRISLKGYEETSDFLNTFSASMNCSFTDYCRALANIGPSVIILDEAPVNSSDTAKHIESNVENFIHIAKSYLNETTILICSGGRPKTAKVPPIKLDTLEEPDTRVYLQSQSACIAEEITAIFVSKVHRLTEGLVAKIDQVLRQLQVVSIDTIDPPEISVGRNIQAVEDASHALIRTIEDLESKKSMLFERAYSLLQILSLLPNGESVSNLKHFDPINPIFTDHALILYDRNLIEGKSINVLIGQNGNHSSLNKVMVALPQVREYVMSRMNERQVSKILKLAADHYFGKEWSTGNHKRSKITKIVEQESAGLSGNAHALLLRMLNDRTSRTLSTPISSVLKICVAYCSSLFSADQYRRVVSVANEMLALISDEYSSEINSIETILSKALRMSGAHDQALRLSEKLLHGEIIHNKKLALLNNIALSLQSLGEIRAIEVSRDIIAMAPKSAQALQARSIILEMQDDDEKLKSLLVIEKKSRQSGHITVANNLALRRINSHDAPGANSTLRLVYESAINSGDPYNAHRAATKIANFSFLQTGKISSEDLKKLMAAYQYFYGERFGNLFTRSHKALWNYFESTGETDNLVALFRHSSFVWRLNGEEINEQIYLTALNSKKSEILSIGSEMNKNTLYFLSRSQNQKTKMDAIQNKDKAF